MTVPWGPAVATGVGSMPGENALEAARIVAGELPDFVHVVELPARGPGADMVGRTGALLAGVEVGFGLETTPDGWRFAGAVGRQTRRAASFLNEDLDALEETTQRYGGPVKAQVVGPWTMAAAIELRSGERALSDPGAVTEIADALAAALIEHVADLRRRVPEASAIVVQVDEPGLPAVLDGRVGTASGLSRYAAVDPQEMGRVLSRVLGAVPDAITGVHCCAAGPPVPLLREAGAAFVSLDLIDVDDQTDQALGLLLEAGEGLIAGTVPSTGSGRVSDTAASAAIRGLLDRLGLNDPQTLARIAVSPTCGLAGASPSWARTALEACTAVGRVLRQDEDEEGPDARRG